MHASPGAPAVDVYVMGDATPVIEALAYGQTSPYLDVPAGDYVFEVRAAGEPADSAPVYSTDSLTLAAGDSVTAIAAGQVGGEGDAAFRVLALADGFGDPGEGALARIVHAGADAPAVYIDVGNDGSAELEGVARYADSGAEGVALPAGEALQVGILAGGEPVTAFTTPEIPAGVPVYVIATGLLGDLPRQETGFALLAVGPTVSLGFIQQNPRVYALHAGSDAPTVDICTGGAPLLEGVAYGAIGGIQVPPGVYTLYVHVTGDEPCAGDSQFTVDTPPVVPGEQYLAIAAGELTDEDGEPTFNVAFAVEDFSLDGAADAATVEVGHFAAAPAVEVNLVDAPDAATFNGSLFGLSFGEFNGRDFPIVEDQVIVALSTDTTGPTYDVDATFTVAAPDGVRAWVLAIGSIAPDMDEQSIELAAILTTTSPWSVIRVAPNGN